MSERVLSAKEIMCIAAGLGATELYGIPDEFEYDSGAALTKELLDVQRSLEGKGYLSEDFDGNLTIEEMVVDLVSVCADCKKFIAVDKQMKKRAQEGLLFYVKGTDAVKAVVTEDGFALEKMDASMLGNEMKNILEWTPSPLGDDVDCTVENAVLEKAKTLKGRGAGDAARAELISGGMDESIAGIVLSGLSAGETFYSFTFTDFTAESGGVRNVMFINSEERSLQLDVYMNDEKDAVRFTDVTCDRALDELLAQINALDIAGEEFE